MTRFSSALPLPDPARPLTDTEAADAFARILDGDIDDTALSRFLVTLSDRGETVTEIVAAAQALRARQCFAIDAPDAIDIVGTGGDGKHSLNVSTATAIVVAACGIPVAKHGNRAASSSSGAADVLAALGIPDVAPDRLRACLDSVGITFLHAARHHPAMARVAPVRRALGRRTIFNLLGPLANPAGVRRQLVGVFAPGIMRPMAEALAALGSTNATIVHGDGYDEMTVTGDSQMVTLAGGHITEAAFAPETANVGRHPAAALAGADPAYNAARLTALLGGETGAYRDIVVLNAAAALRVADPALDWTAAATRASDALAGGAAAGLLARWKEFR